MCEMKEPVIRFKGYTDEWEQRKLGELVNIGDIDHRMPKTVECGIPYLMTGDFCGINELNFDGVKHISEEDYEQLSRKIKPEKNDILFARYASVGAVRYVDFTDKFLISYSCAIIKHGDKIDSKYLYHYLTSDIAQRQIALEINTGSQANIGIDSMKNNILVQMPCVDEQRTVASYLDSLDNLITLHQRKCDDLQEVKKYMLQKLFPQNGAKIPEIRFPGFTGEWVQRKLGDIATSFDYGLNAAAKEYDGTNAYIRITDIDDDSHSFISDGITSPDTDLSKADDYKVAEGDILFARTGASVGKSYIYKPSDGLMYFAGFLIRARVKPEYDAQFVFQNTLTETYSKYIAVTSQRSGQPGVNAQEYAEYEIMCPTREEQIKIGEHFKNLDNLIALQQRKCDDLKEVKRYMLQNMFPQGK